MRIVFLIVIIVHGLIHLAGFLKAFEFSEIKQLTAVITKLWGVLWLLACVSFLLFAWVYVFGYKYWWLIGLSAVLLSQLLVIAFWKDARFGTIPNIIVLLLSVVGLSQFNFNKLIKKDAVKVTTVMNKKSETFSADHIKGLPASVQNWLKHSGVIGKPIIMTATLQQDFKLRLKPNQENWYHGHAKQYFNTLDPSFLWTIDLQMLPLLSVKGRDLFYQGKGAMLIKVLSLVPVVDEQNNPKINQGTLQRYLGEIVWFPTAAVSPFIEWEKIDEYSAKARMTYKGVSGSGIFTFDKQGAVIKYSAMRYMGSGEDARPYRWVIDIKESAIKNGIKIPVQCEATWKLDEKDWTWAKIAINDISYNKNIDP